MCSIWRSARECETGEAPAKRLACTPSFMCLVIKHTGRESFRQDRPESGSDQHQDENRIEHSFIQHSLTVRVDSVIGDTRCVKQGGLRTKDRRSAEKLLHAKSEAYRSPTLNLTIVRG